MEYIVKGPHYLLYCAACSTALLVTTEMALYCPQCDIAETKAKAKGIFLCGRCGHPLQVAKGPTPFCNHCKVFPDPEEVVGDSICPACRTRHELGRCKPRHRGDN